MINNSIIKQLPILLVVLLFLSPILPVSIQSTAIILGGLSAFVKIVKEKSFGGLNLGILVASSSLFLLYILSYLFFGTDSTSSEYLRLTIPLFVLPLFFLLFSKELISHRIYKHLGLIFSMAILVKLLILNIQLFNPLYLNEIPSWDLRQKIELVSKMHGTYLSLWISVAVLFLLISVLKTKNKLNLKILFILVIIYFFYWLFLVRARFPLFTCVALSLFLVFYLPKINILKKLTFIVSLIFIVSIILLNFTKGKELIHKIERTLDYNGIKVPQGKYSDNYYRISGEDIRYGIYLCSYNIFLRNKLFGVGIGRVDQALQKCYDNSFNTDTYGLNKYNSHNQYIHIALATGGIGLLVFLISLGYLIKINSSNLPYMIIIILMIVCLLTENILSRHHGVLLFGLMNSYLLVLTNKQK